MSLPEFQIRSFSAFHLFQFFYLFFVFSLKCVLFCHDCPSQISYSRSHRLVNVQVHLETKVLVITDPRNTPYLLFTILPHLLLFIHCADVLKTPPSSNFQNASHAESLRRLNWILLQLYSLFICQAESLHVERKPKLYQHICWVDITSDPDSWWVLKPIIMSLCVNQKGRIILNIADEQKICASQTGAADDIPKRDCQRAWWRLLRHEQLNARKYHILNAEALGLGRENWRLVYVSWEKRSRMNGQEEWKMRSSNKYPNPQSSALLTFHYHLRQADLALPSPRLKQIWRLRADWVLPVDHIRLAIFSMQNNLRFEYWWICRFSLHDYLNIRVKNKELPDDTLDLFSMYTHLPRDVLLHQDRQELMSEN